MKTDRTTSAVFNCLGIQKVKYFEIANASSMLFSVKSKLCQKFIVRLKNILYCHVNFFCLSYFLVNIRLIVFNFPAKRLRKNTGAQNTHALFFLKFHLIVAISNFYLKMF